MRPVANRVCVLRARIRGANPLPSSIKDKEQVCHLKNQAPSNETNSSPRNGTRSPRGRNFLESAIPTLAMLCHWYAVVEKCMDDVTYGDEIQVAYSNEDGDVKALPQLTTLKQASAEIRAINKQLEIVNQLPAEKPKKRETPLNVIQSNRFTRAKNSRTA